MIINKEIEFLDNNIENDAIQNVNYKMFQIFKNSQNPLEMYMRLGYLLKVGYSNQ